MIFLHGLSDLSAVSIEAEGSLKLSTFANKYVVLRGAKHVGGHRPSKHISPGRASETSVPLVHQIIHICEGMKM